MKKINLKVAFFFCFAIYQVWGAYWIGICVYPTAEECVSATWVLLLTGLPLTLPTIWLGGVGIPELIIKSIIGGVNFGLIVLGLFYLQVYMRKIANE